MRENNKMQRGAFFCLWILFTFSLFAQNKENGSVACDSIVYKNTFGKALKKFLNFSDFDTTYISPNRYNYALMLDHFTNYEYYSVGNDDQRLRFSPNPHNKIGAYFGWRWIFLGWAVDTDWLYGKKSKKKRGTEFDLSLYSSKLGVDIFYRSTGNDYKIHKVSGFSDEIPSNYSEDFNGLKVKMKGLNLYYIFNNRRFSYPAAFSQSTNQRCNAGSFIAGFSVSTHNLNFDYTKLPEIIQETMNPGMKVKHIKYTNISLNAGYAYNWVFARNCLACLSFNPAVAYKTSRIEKTEEREADDWYKNFNIDFILRARCGIQQQQILRGYLIRRTDIRLLQKQFLPKQRVRYPPNICRIQLLSEKGVPEEQKVKKAFSPHLPSKAINTLHPYYILPLILLPLPAIEDVHLPALGQGQRNTPTIAHPLYSEVLCLIQTIIHLGRSIRFQLALRNVIGKLRTRAQAELISMPIERILKALTQGQFHPLHTGRQSAFQTVAVPELPAICPPIAVMRLIPSSKLQERQQLIASPHLQPPPVCLSQIILCTPLQPTGNSKCRLQLIFETGIRPSGKILLLRPQGKRRNNP